ncbi:ThuA domain-containing protein [Pseudonocardia parietis]|uniref:Type 1 glutamine amidotransferase n=1 Tax=Pseudonocardia parietis TaxID=570936 RepID=A0ABS4VRI8_9PSEU|nr:ThuA domain-containing protein [Pseudonocardia parietis]MBP2366543.1 type 1 glutamine amidotransferase [Pseudonocardia parietis]
MRAVLLSGGLTHDFPATTGCLTELLAGAGFDVGVHTGTSGVDSALEDLPGAALLVVNALRWTMTCAGTPERYRAQAEVEAASPSPRAREALGRHLAAGGGVLAMHTATLCFDDWPGWADTLGARWEWGHSHHPPLGPPIDVTVGEGHPVVDGIDDFTIVDEVYSDLRTAPGLTALATAATPATDAVQPMLWAREHGGGRVVYDALGHHPPSYAVPEHREIVRRAIGWVTSG